MERPKRRTLTMLAELAAVCSLPLTAVSFPHAVHQAYRLMKPSAATQERAADRERSKCAPDVDAANYRAIDALLALQAKSSDGRNASLDGLAQLSSPGRSPDSAIDTLLAWQASSSGGRSASLDGLAQLSSQGRSPSVLKALSSKEGSFDGLAQREALRVVSSDALDEFKRSRDGSSDALDELRASATRR